MTSVKLKTALVTGGAKRIGAAIVRELAAHDYAVAIHASHSGDEADAIRAEIVATGGRAVVILGDLTQPGFRENLIAEASRQIGPIDVLVNNASIFQRDSVEHFDEELFDRHFEVHVKAPSILNRDFARLLQLFIRSYL